jgi:subtilase family serine protease
MRFRYVAAVLVPAGAAASVFAILPTGASAGIGASVGIGVAQYAAGRVAEVPARRVIPEVSSPLAYRYVGNASAHGGKSGFLFACQKPGAALNCYTPQELATAYGIPGTLTGAGQTIVIIDAFGDPTITADLATEDSAFGLPSANLDIIYPDGKEPFNPSNADEVNWTGEIALDVESAHAVAPAAKIDLVIAKTDSDPSILDALKYVVKNQLGSVLSQSYGEAEACEAPSVVAADHVLFAQAELDHMTVFASSGDNGAGQASCSHRPGLIKGVSVPAADPLVTSVGATSLTATQPVGTYVSETAWNDQYGSGGGGYSTLFARPAYQDGFVHNRARGVPDVSYSGDVNNGLLIAWSGGVASQVGSIYVYGGTSAGSPQWAAITALADQAAHHPLGLLNDDLYEISHGSQYRYVFRDVTTGNNTVSFTNSSKATVTIGGYSAGPGWDAVTGLGTPDVAHLINVLEELSPAKPHAHA